MSTPSPRPLRIQLWSYNYDPEPTGIAPLSTTWAKEMVRRGHSVEVVAAHPHYPEPVWGRRLMPYREERDGIPVLRLPLWVGRATAMERVRQELTYTAAQTAAIPALSTPDVIVAMSPSFPALGPTMLNARLRRIPWVLWLKDILPDGAVATGVMEGGTLVRAARRFERAAYSSASHILVISETFVDNLLAKGVPREKITRIYDWATRRVGPRDALPDPAHEPRVLVMGNIGYSQGLPEIVRAFQADESVRRAGAKIVLAGSGVAAADVEAEVVSDRVEMTGLLFGDDLEAQLQTATLGAVTQSYDGTDFNVPSKLMNYLAYGLPVIAAVRLNSEVAHIVETSGGGWVTDATRPGDFAEKVGEVLQDREELERRGRAGLEFAQRYLTPAHAAERAEEILRQVVADGPRG